MAPPRVIVFGGQGNGPGAGPPGARGARWLRYVLIGLLLLVLVELLVLIALGQSIGVWWTIGLLVLLSLAGAWVMRKEGRRTWKALRTAVNSGTMPAREVADAMLVLLGGALLLLPGFVSDLLGLFLILPFTRPVTRTWLEAVIARRALGGFPGGGAHGPPGPGRPPRPGASRARGDEVVEGEIIDDDDGGPTGR